MNSHPWITPPWKNQTAQTKILEIVMCCSWNFQRPVTMEFLYLWKRKRFEKHVRVGSHFEFLLQVLWKARNFECHFELQVLWRSMSFVCHLSFCWSPLEKHEIWIPFWVFVASPLEKHKIWMPFLSFCCKSFGEVWDLDAILSFCWKFFGEAWDLDAILRFCCKSFGEWRNIKFGCYFEFHLLQVLWRNIIFGRHFDFLLQVLWRNIKFGCYFEFHLLQVLWRSIIFGRHFDFLSKSFGEAWNLDAVLSFCCKSSGETWYLNVILSFRCKSLVNSFIYFHLDLFSKYTLAKVIISWQQYENWPNVIIIKSLTNCNIDIDEKIISRQKMGGLHGNRLSIEFLSDVTEIFRVWYTAR